MEFKRILAGFIALAMTMGMMSSLALADEAENAPEETSVAETSEHKEKETKNSEEKKPAESKEAEPEETKISGSKKEEQAEPAGTQPVETSEPKEKDDPETTTVTENGRKNDVHAVPPKNEQQSVNVISTVTATSNIESLPVYGESVVEPTFSITAGQPASVINAKWQKYNESTGKWAWITTSEKFTDGKWRCRIRFYIESADYVFDSNGVNVSINGKVWASIGDNGMVTTPIIPYITKSTDDLNYISYFYATSPEFTIDEPAGMLLALDDSFSSVSIPFSRVGTAIKSLDISEYVLGGKKPYVFSKHSGPDWISVSESGVITGTPTAAGTNAVLMIKVTDAKGGKIIDEIPVGTTYHGLEGCDEVSAVTATSNIDSLPVLGAAVEEPTFIITAGQPASVVRAFWQKYDESTGKWSKVDTPAKFTEGKWRCKIQVYILSVDYVFDSNGITVTINDKVWPSISDNGVVTNPIIPSVYPSTDSPDFISYLWATSPEYKIEKKAITPEVSLSATAFTYNGKVQKPTVVVNDGSTVLDSSQYDVTYSSGCKNVGTYKVTVTMKGDYSGSETLSYNIIPKGTKLSKVKKAKKAATVKWKKQAGKMSSSRITGYQIQMATDSAFTNNKKTVNVKGYKKTSKKVSKLKGGKKYWVRIRTYKKVGSTTYYSSWSTVKTVKTKK